MIVVAVADVMLLLLPILDQEDQTIGDETRIGQVMTEQAVRVVDQRIAVKKKIERESMADEERKHQRLVEESRGPRAEMMLADLTVDQDEHQNAFYLPVVLNAGF
jgi:hypothetical protein